MSSEGIDHSTDQIVDENTRRRRLKLHRAALNGDWEVAKRIFDVYEDGIRDKISRLEDTALHIATRAMRIDFVKELLKKLNKDDVAQKNKNGKTALFLAAASGMVELAKEIIKKDKEIANTPDDAGTLPICMAAALGHKDMVDCLYKETKHSLKDKDREELFITSIETELYDFALQLLEQNPNLATARALLPDPYPDPAPAAAPSPAPHPAPAPAPAPAPSAEKKKGVTALHVLARKHMKFSNLAHQNQMGIFRRCFNLGAEDEENKKLLQARQLVELIWKRVALLNHNEISQLIAKPRKLLFDAAKRGNDEFLCILIRGYPDLIRKFDNKKNNYSIFHIAVKYRQVDVFKHIHEASSKETFLLTRDGKGNNILHLAGMLAPQDRLNIVPGAALQMQRELLWFKEVEELVQKSFAEARNKKGCTPRVLFTEQHEGLRDKGEKWMKDTAQSCMVVATLIATVAFAAAFTVPGGNNDDTGFPFFLEKLSFKIFAIADAISLVSSSASIMYFLSILTSRYAEEDFLSSLPRKLRVGLVTLFVSIATMMVVFSTTFFIVFNDKRLWIAILVTVIASTPVLMFIWHHMKLFYDILSSTDSLFRQGKRSLFRKEGEVSESRMTKIPYALAIKCQCTCSTNV